MQDGRKKISEYGSLWEFRHSAILPALSDRMQNYFAFIYRTGRLAPGAPALDVNWLRALLGPTDPPMLDHVADRLNSMWCTATFFHASRRTVTRDGQIVPLGQSEADAVFAFEGIRVSCDDQGITDWSPDSSARDRFILRVRDTARYSGALTAAMKTLLTQLP